MISKTICFYTFLFLLVFNSSFSQEKFTLSGTITDSKSNETLIGVNVFFPELKKGTTTNEYGFYSITLPKGNYKIQVSYLGFQTVEETISLDKNIKNNFILTSNEEQLQEVIVIGSENKTNTHKAEMGVNKLSIATIKKMPVVLGEVDVLNLFYYFPGSQMPAKAPQVLMSAAAGPTRI